MSRKANAWMPWASDFAAGDFWRGGAGALMQGTLVFWPLAYRLARGAAARRAMDERLLHVAAAYAVPRKLPPAPETARDMERDMERESDAAALREAA